MTDTEHRRQEVRKQLREWQRPLSSTAEMKQRLKAMSTTWTDEALLSKRMLLYACERLDEIASLLRRKKRDRKPSKYNQFVSEQMRNGRALSEAVKAWKDRGGGSR